MKSLVTTTILVFLYLQGYTQNPYKYETQIITLTFSTQSGIPLVTTSKGGFHPDIITRSNMTNYEYNIGWAEKSKRFIDSFYSRGLLKESIIKAYNNEGYRLVFVENEGLGIYLYFEKSDSYREAELQKLINELTTRIDAASKKHTDSAMAAININVLNYLKSIPNDVITKEYKEQLTKQVLSEAEAKLKQLTEELKKEVRNTSTANRQ